jgi:endosialidase-like protein
MKSIIMWVVMLVVCLFPAPAVWAQTPASGNQSATTSAPSASAALVPRLIKFTGTLLDAQNRPMAGPVGVTFALYAQQRGGAALWMETQNVKPDGNGEYAIFLGAESSQGVPAELFATGEARWLGIEVERQAEQERILLVSVPYALKAADAESLGGLPASAYALAQASASTVGGVASTSGAVGTSGASGTSVPGSGATPQGTAAKPTKNARAQSAAAIATNFIPVFKDNAGTLGSSVLLQNPSSNFLGVGTASPVSALDLRLTGAAVGDVLSVGNQSGGGRFGVLSFSRGAGAPFIVQGDVGDDLVLGANLTEKMRITSAGNVGIGTSGPFATLDVKGTANQLLVESSTSGGEASMGFIPGGSMHKWQAGANSAGPGFFVYENGGGYHFFIKEGGAVNINGSLNFPATTNATTGVINLGGAPFAHGFGPANTFLGGFAGNFTMTGGHNTAIGSQALQNNTAGSDNTASGAGALFTNTAGGFNTANGVNVLLLNTTGGANTAIGYLALASNTTGFNNTALGFAAGGGLSSNANTTGDNNTFIGANAGPETSTQLTHATAIGADTKVIASNTIVLGNGSVSVGIGTPMPDNLLTVNGTADKPGGGSWGTFSDGRLKTVFGAFHPGLAQVLKLRPIVYRYKEQNALGIKDTEEHVGFVAQEVEKVIPEAVTKDAEGYRILNNDPILWTMLNAIKEQQGEIVALKARLVRLEVAPHSGPSK